MGKDSYSMTFSTSGIMSIDKPVGLVDKQGNPVETTIAAIDRKEAAKYTKAKGWYIDWKNQPEEATLYKVTANGSNTAEGLMGVIDRPDAMAVEITWIVSAPHNQALKVGAENKKFDNVADVLLSKAIDLSVEKGYNGMVMSKAANSTLMRRYTERWGAVQHSSDYKFHIPEATAQNFRRRYSWN